MANALKINPATKGTNNSNPMEQVASVLLDKDGNDISITNPIPVTSTAHISTDLEGSGIVAVGTTAVALAFTGTTESIIISAATTNTGLIYIGKSNVTNLGANAVAFLSRGESLTIDYEDSINAIYVVSDTAAQSIIYGASL